MPQKELVQTSVRKWQAGPKYSIDPTMKQVTDADKMVGLNKRSVAMIRRWEKTRKKSKDMEKKLNKAKAHMIRDDLTTVTGGSMTKARKLAENLGISLQPSQTGSVPTPPPHGGTMMDQNVDVNTPTVLDLRGRRRSDAKALKGIKKKFEKRYGKVEEAASPELQAAYDKIAALYRIKDTLRHDDFERQAETINNEIRQIRDRDRRQGPQSANVNAPTDARTSNGPTPGLDLNASPRPRQVADARQAILQRMAHRGQSDVVKRMSGYPSGGPVPRENPYPFPTLSTAEKERRAQRAREEPLAWAEREKQIRREKLQGAELKNIIARTRAARPGTPTSPSLPPGETYGDWARQHQFKADPETGAIIKPTSYDDWQEKRRLEKEAERRKRIVDFSHAPGLDTKSRPEETGLMAQVRGLGGASGGATETRNIYKALRGTYFKKVKITPLGSGMRTQMDIADVAGLSHFKIYVQRPLKTIFFDEVSVKGDRKHAINAFNAIASAMPSDWLLAMDPYAIGNIRQGKGTTPEEKQHLTQGTRMLQRLRAEGVGQWADNTQARRVKKDQYKAEKNNPDAETEVGQELVVQGPEDRREKGVHGVGHNRRGPEDTEFDVSYDVDNQPERDHAQGAAYAGGETEYDQSAEQADAEREARASREFHHEDPSGSVPGGAEKATNAPLPSIDKEPFAPPLPPDYHDDDDEEEEWDDLEVTPGREYAAGSASASVPTPPSPIVHPKNYKKRGTRNEWDQVARKFNLDKGEVDRAIMDTSSSGARSVKEFEELLTLNLRGASLPPERSSYDPSTNTMNFRPQEQAYGTPDVPHGVAPGKSQGLYNDSRADSGTKKLSEDSPGVKFLMDRIAASGLGPVKTASSVRFPKGEGPPGLRDGGVGVSNDNVRFIIHRTNKRGKASVITAYLVYMNPRNINQVIGALPHLKFPDMGGSGKQYVVNHKNNFGIAIKTMARETPLILASEPVWLPLARMLGYNGEDEASTPGNMTGLGELKKILRELGVLKTAKQKRAAGNESKAVSALRSLRINEQSWYKDNVNVARAVQAWIIRHLGGYQVSCGEIHDRFDKDYDEQTVDNAIEILRSNAAMYPMTGATTQGRDCIYMINMTRMSGALL